MDALYINNKLEFKSGCFRVNGDTVDIFPAIETFDGVAYRIEFWGDEDEIFSNINFENSLNFFECVSLFYKSLYESEQKYPSFFNIHSLTFTNRNKSEGQSAMFKYLFNLKNEFKTILNNDAEIKKDFFTDESEKDDFINFVFLNVFNSISKGREDCPMLKKIVKSCLYIN